jgi:polysaccharide export outer membrane protein
MKTQAKTRSTAILAAILLLTAASAAEAQSVAAASAAQAAGAKGINSGEARETLGVGDSIRITVFQNPDLSTETRVSEKGTIQYPLLGEVKLAGETANSAAHLIADKLKKGNYVRNPQVSVAVTTVRSRQVSVLGEVTRPGRYPLEDANPKLTDILALAGGLTPAADASVTVILQRGGESKKLEVDVPKMYRTGDLSANFDVQPGDMIYVQRAPVFYIYGEVQRAGSYRLDKGLSVMHAITLASGLTPRGTERGLKIHRRGADGKTQKLDAQPGDPIQADDVIYVKESIF